GRGAVGASFGANESNNDICDSSGTIRSRRKDSEPLRAVRSSAGRWVTRIVNQRVVQALAISQKLGCASPAGLLKHKRSRAPGKSSNAYTRRGVLCRNSPLLLIPRSSKASRTWRRRGLWPSPNTLLTFLPPRREIENERKAFTVSSEK